MDHMTALAQLTQNQNPIGTLRAFLGAYDFHKSDKSVGFKFKGSKVASHVKIELNGGDLYNVKFVKIWGTKLLKEKEYTDMYAEDIKGLFENHTGLYLSF
ncbi:MAG: hypothetical protein DRH08_05805 [Deltaproteobacteria bacterium]|nr:MAG: hypothetical protein DRH08_05805 [Deltaproteobacteria bacterium]